MIAFLYHSNSLSGLTTAITSLEKSKSNKYDGADVVTDASLAIDLPTAPDPGIGALGSPLLY